MITAADLNFGRRRQVFGLPKMTAALLVRVTHHSETPETGSGSQRRQRRLPPKTGSGYSRRQ
ncbi:MAG: ATP-binding protein [Deltaproteobacteria bacterium]|nr:ATP-binding protein [Deltaproteobacteria bacterium]